MQWICSLHLRTSRLQLRGMSRQAFVSMLIYIYIYICVCLCICTRVLYKKFTLFSTDKPAKKKSKLKNREDLTEGNFVILYLHFNISYWKESPRYFKSFKVGQLPKPWDNVVMIPNKHRTSHHLLSLNIIKCWYCGIISNKSMFKLLCAQVGGLY